VHCQFYYVDADGSRLSRTDVLPEGKVLRDLVCGCFIWSGGPLIRRACLERVGLFDGQIPTAGDWDMWLRIARAGYLFACVQEPLGAYRVHADSIMANMERLERGTFVVLDKVFADPQLPAEVAALKTEAYGRMRFFVSCRCYGSGRWDDARRNLSEALALRPSLAEHPETLMELFCDDALGPSLRGNAVRFIGDVLDHLPEVAAALRPYRARCLARVHMGLALRSYGSGDVAEAQRELMEAITSDSAILEQPEIFASALVHNALRLPISDPLRYVDSVLQNLPSGARRLARVRSHVYSDVNIGCAFQDYAAGHRGRVTRQVLTGLRYRPAWLTNRGVVSIFLKSLPALWAKVRAAG
jgi:hypothetical protein